jgi:hypothetical protein
MAKVPNNAPKASSAKPASAEADSSDPAASPDLAAVMARARWLMLIAMGTTAIAVAAVLGVIGYRLFGLGGNAAQTITNGTVFIPKNAHVVSTTVSDGRIVVTLDIAGASEVRIYDLKTFRQIGDLRFATEQ